jgi:DNA uptake protein ComE-like DNA-binding protein
VLELRKNITQGSLWFAITTLSFLAIVRCHTQSQHAKTLGKTIAPQQTPDTPNGNKFRKYPYKRKWKEDHYQAWKNGKPLQAKLALDLLLALRNSQHKNTPLQFSPDSAKLVAELLLKLKKDNPFPKKLDWNQMDSSDWEHLPGIGPATAKRIVKYKNKLGGFANPHQIMEVPKIDTLLAQLLIQSWTATNTPTVKINTTPAWKQLYTHPYIGPIKAKILHPFFTQHPNLTPSDWNNMQGLTPQEKDPITPYLAFTNKE